MTTTPPSDSRLEAGEVDVAVEAAAFGVRDAALAPNAGDRVLGGGAVGRVTAAGEAAGEWIGRRVIVGRLGPCGECRFCRRGAVAGCADRGELGADRPGTLAPSVIARARWLAPADGPLAVAAPGAAVLGDDALVAYSLYCRAGVAAGEPVVCVGDGPRTALLAQIARAKGAKVVAVDRVDETRSLAEAVAEAANQRDDFAERPWRVFALDGGAIGALPAGSTVAIAGGASIDAAAIAAAAATVVAGDHGHPDLLPELVALAARGDLDLDAVIEPVASAAEAPAALERRRIGVVSFAPV